MTTVALIDSSGLLGKELRELLGEGSAGREGSVRLYTRDPEEAGALAELGGAASLVTLAEADGVGACDVAFDCGAGGTVRSTSDARLTIYLPASGQSSAGPPAVAGVNDTIVDDVDTLVSPGAGVVACSLILAALVDAQPRRLSATVLEPVSLFGQEGIDQLLDQTRAVLAFQEPSTEALGRRLAFNLHSEPAGGSSTGEASLRALLADETLEVALQRVQCGCFHGVGVAMQIGFASKLEAEEAGQLLDEHPLIERVGGSGLDLAQVVGSSNLMVGAVRNAPGPGHWLTLWAAIDNLTRGGAANALALARRRFPDL